MPVVIISQTTKIDYYSEFLKTKKNYKATTTEVFHKDSTLVKSYTLDFLYFNNGFVITKIKNSEMNVVEIDSTIYSPIKTNEYTVKIYSQGKLNYVCKGVSSNNNRKYYINKKLQSVTKYNTKDSSLITLIKKNSKNKKHSKTIDTKTRMTVYRYKNDSLEETSVYYKSKTVDSEYPLHFLSDSLVQLNRKGMIFSKIIWTYNKYGDITKEQYYDPNLKDPYFRYTTYEYIYDEKGNWIEKTETQKNGSSITLLDKTTTYVDYTTLYKRSIIY